MAIINFNSISGVSTISVASSITVGNNVSIGTDRVTATTFSGNLTGNVTGTVNSSGIATFTNGPVIIGSGTSTGTASQRLQVSGGAYVSGSLGIGNSLPSSPLDVQGGQIRIRSSGTYSDPTDNAGVIGYDNSGGDLTISARSSGGSTAISFRTSNSGTGAERVRIDSSGRVTRPFTPHIFGSVTNTSTATNSLANSMNVVSSTELTFSNSRITVPVTGLYLITFCTISAQDSSRKDANIYINGIIYVNMLSEDTTTGFHYRGGSLAVKLVANDYIQFYNQNWYNNTATSFEAWRTASVTFLG